MALTRTTLAAAVADANDTTISVTSATGFVADQIIRIDNEWMVIQKNYTSGTIIPVRRGQQGSKGVAHVITAGVATGTFTEWTAPGAPAVVNNAIAGRCVDIVSVTATSTLAGLVPGHDTRVILNGTSVITLTIPVPTADMDGDCLTIISNGAAAHVPTFTGGLGGAGTSYDAITNNATGKMALTVYAANLTWQIPQAPALTGTVTNITGGIA